MQVERGHCGAVGGVGAVRLGVRAGRRGGIESKVMRTGKQVN